MHVRLFLGTSLCASTGGVSLFQEVYKLIKVHLINQCLLQIMYSLYLRERIVRLSKRKQLVRKLAEEGFTVTVSGCNSFLKKYHLTGSIFDRPCSGTPKILPLHAEQLIDGWLKANDELTTTQLHQRLQANGYNVSRSTTAQTRKSIGWTAKRTR